MHSLVRFAFIVITLAGMTANAAESIELDTLKASLIRPVEVPFPKENPHSVAKEELGKTLFFGPRLSNKKSTSCASCHNPGLAWGDGLPNGVGFNGIELKRKTPTILNLAWGELYFWDGRAESLETQALRPIESPGGDEPPGQ